MIYIDLSKLKVSF